DSSDSERPTTATAWPWYLRGSLRISQTVTSLTCACATSTLVTTESATATTPRIPISIQQYATTISVQLFTTTVCLTLLAAGANAQGSAATSNERLPGFEAYPVTDIFKGPPAPPKLRRPADRLFRTTLREGAARGPNFA